MNTTSPTTLNLAIEDMSCGHCVARVTQALTNIAGVEIISVAVGSAQLGVADGSAAKAAVAALADAGYSARAESPATSPAKQAGGCCGGSRTSDKANTGGGSCCG
jgi:copper chaperone CopZ